MRRVNFTVSFALPRGASVADAREYVDDAVATWRGSLRYPGGYGEDDPGDPMFGLDNSTVRVTHKYKQKARNT